MKDPGPYPVELLKAIFDKAAPAGASYPGLHGLGRIIYPAIFLDDGSGAFPFATRGTGAGWEAKYAQPANFVGTMGLECSTRETGATVADFSWAEIYLPDSPLPIVRVQVLFRRPSTTSDDARARIRLFHDDTALHYTADFFILFAQHIVQAYTKQNGAWAMTPIPDCLVQEAENQWHHMNFSINKLTHQYVDFALNGHAFALPALPLESGASAGRCHLLYLGLAAEAGAAEQAVIHFDQILVTAEEAT